MFLSLHTAHHPYLIDLPHEAKQRKTERQNSTCSYGSEVRQCVQPGTEIKLKAHTGRTPHHNHHEAFHDPLHTNCPYTLRITCNVRAPAWRSRLHTPWQLEAHLHTHPHTAVVYYHCDLKREAPHESFPTTKHDTALPKLQHRDQVLTNNDNTSEGDRKLRTSSSFICPPVHRKVFQRQKGQICKYVTFLLW